MKKITFKQAFSCISIGVILAILFCVVLSSCSVSRPVNNGNLEAYHQDLQKYYQHKR